MAEPWQKQEKRIAKQMGGSVNALSGAGDRKGDVRAPGYLVEAKWTGKKSFTLKSDVLEKIASEAWAEGREPVLAIDLNNKSYVLIEWDHFMALQEMCL